MQIRKELIFRPRVACWAGAKALHVVKRLHGEMKEREALGSTIPAKFGAECKDG